MFEHRNGSYGDGSVVLEGLLVEVERTALEDV